MAMTSRERLITVIEGRLPDHVPVAPDTSNMIPARLTGKPFWDLYLFQDPPIWKAYLDCVKYFGFDSLMDGYVSIDFDDLPLEDDGYTYEEVIVYRSPDRIVTQKYREERGKKIWADTVDVYYIADPPTMGLDPHSISLPSIPDHYEPIGEIRQWPKGEELLKYVKEEMGDHGLVGVRCGVTKLIESEWEIYDYFDNPDKYFEKRDRYLEHYVKKFHRLMELECKPDFICTGNSGTLIHQTPQMFRDLALPIVKEITALCKEYGIPSHVHSCGPQKELVKIMAEETDLTIIDPLEIPPMGDCDLGEIKRLYGDRLVLKGNIHTTEVMLRGTTADVAEAAKRCIDQAAEGGRFILSTGDQCGRDTPDENIFTMIEVAKTYGRY